MKEILKNYAVRNGNTINLNPSGLEALGWKPGTVVKQLIDTDNDRIILERIKPKSDDE